MPITFSARNKRWHYQFNRVIAGERHRASRLLPKGWTRQQADEYDRIESARLYAVATGVTKLTPLIDDAVLLYLQQHAPNLKNFENLRRELAACQDAYLGRPMSDLPDIAREYQKSAHRADSKIKLNPATVRNRLAYLRAACRWAWKNHKMGEHDPAERMVLPRVRNERHVYLTRTEFLKICRCIRPGGERAAVRIAFYSGMRAAEVGKATVVLDGFCLTDTKNGSPRIVPIHPKVAHITRNLALWPIRPTRWTVSTAFKIATRKAGYPQARLHDLRHSTASAMINAGVDLFTVGGVLGHKSAVSTKRYAHLATSTLSNAIGLVGKKVPTLPKKKAA